MAFCRPVPSFSKVARQVEIKNEDGLRFAVQSRPGLLAVPPAGPYGGPGPLRTLMVPLPRWYNLQPNLTPLVAPIIGSLLLEVLSATWHAPVIGGLLSGQRVRTRASNRYSAGSNATIKESNAPRDGCRSGAISRGSSSEA